MEKQAIDGDTTKETTIECAHDAANPGEDLHQRQECNDEISKQRCEYSDKIDPKQQTQVILDRESSAENAQMQHNAQPGCRGPDMAQIGAQGDLEHCQSTHSKRAVTCQNDLSKRMVKVYTGTSGEHKLWPYNTDREERVIEANSKQ